MLGFSQEVEASLNMGVTPALLPVKWLPLPFVSHGGFSPVVAKVVAGILTTFLPSNVSCFGSTPSDPWNAPLASPFPSLLNLSETEKFEVRPCAHRMRRHRGTFVPRHRRG
jgi:hypothetical protein